MSTPLTQITKGNPDMTTTFTHPEVGDEAVCEACGARLLYCMSDNTPPPEITGWAKIGSDGSDGFVCFPNAGTGNPWHVPTNKVTAPADIPVNAFDGRLGVDYANLVGGIEIFIHDAIRQGYPVETIKNTMQTEIQCIIDLAV